LLDNYQPVQRIRQWDGYGYRDIYDINANKQQRQLLQEHMKALVTIMDIIETPTIEDIGPRLRGNNKLGSLRR
jgi:hypothetical protein